MGYKETTVSRGREFLPVGVLLHHLERLEGLHHLASHVLGAPAEVGWADTVPLAAAIDLGHGEHSHATAQVQVTGCGGCARVHTNEIQYSEKPRREQRILNTTFAWRAILDISIYCSL